MSGMLDSTEVTVCVRLRCVCPSWLCLAATGEHQQTVAEPSILYLYWPQAVQATDIAATHHS